MADSENSINKQKYQRRKHKCPVCNKTIVHLPRHLQTKHDWSHSKALNALNLFDLRARPEKISCPVQGCTKSLVNIREHLQTAHEINKEEIESLLTSSVSDKDGDNTSVTVKKKRLYKRQVCPVPGCFAIVTRIHHHLKTGKHKLSGEDPLYWKYLRDLKNKKFIELESVESNPLFSSTESSDLETITSCSDESVFELITKKEKFQSNNDSESESESSSSLLSRDEKLISKKIHKTNTKKWVKRMRVNKEILKNKRSPESLFGESDSTEDEDEEEEEKEEEEEETEEENENENDEEEDDDNEIEDDEEEEDKGETNRKTSSPRVIKNPITKKLLETFVQWLQSIDGGRRNPRSAKMYGATMSKIIHLLDPTEQKISYLLEKNQLREQWLIQSEKTLQPGTIKSELCTLRTFMTFLRIEKSTGLKVSEKAVTTIQQQIKEWLNALKKSLQERSWEKRVKDVENLITPDDIQKFDQSEAVEKAILFLAEHMKNSTSTTPSQNCFCHVRDHLIIRIVIENACRTGPIANMTLKDLDKARRDKDQMVVTILRHKTLSSCGPANLVLSPKVYKWLQNFVKYMRNTIPNVGTSQTDHVFVTFTGKSMSSSMISTQLDSFWQKAMDKPFVRVNATSFRKAVVSEVHGHQPNLKDQLADLMNHDPKTAKNFYRIYEKSGNAATTSRAVQDLMYKRVTASTSNMTETLDPQTSDELIALQEDGHDDMSLRKKEEEVSNYSWTNEEILNLKSEFETAIQNKHIDIQMVEETLQNHVLLGHLDARNVLQKVKEFIIESDFKENTQAKLRELAETEVTSKLSQSESKLFSVYQTKIFWRLFHDLIKNNQRILVQYVETRIQNNPEATKTLTVFSLKQLMTKIHTERSRYKLEFEQAIKALTKTKERKKSSTSYDFLDQDYGNENDLQQHQCSRL